MSYQVDPNATANAVAAQFNKLVGIERSGIIQLGKLLDDSFNAVWNPPAPVTVAAMVAACGTNFLARLATHAALAAIVLAMEADNGISSARHPWAIATVTNGVTTYTAGPPAKYTITPTLDGNGNPTGAATVAAS